MFCKECGYQLEPNTKYCPNCGTKVEFKGIGDVAGKAVWECFGEDVNSESEESSERSIRETCEFEKGKAETNLKGVYRCSLLAKSSCKDYESEVNAWYEDVMGIKLSMSYDWVSCVIESSYAIALRADEEICLKFDGGSFVEVGKFTEVYSFQFDNAVYSFLNVRLSEENHLLVFNKEVGCFRSADIEAFNKLTHLSDVLNRKTDGWSVARLFSIVIFLVFSAAVFLGAYSFVSSVFSFVMVVLLFVGLLSAAFVMLMRFFDEFLPKKLRGEIEELKSAIVRN